MRAVPAQARELTSRPPQSVAFQFFPTLTLFVVELARQGFDWNIVELAEVPPENKPLVKLPGLIGNHIVDW